MSESEESPQPDPFSEIFKTGSMVNLAAELVEDMPERLGAYTVLERIGEGGMGVVYLAEQDPPLVRRVAIKLVRDAATGHRALARFESERQTLAVMNHPNIARVFDAGSAPDSRPYFVMEHVAGECITEFCDARKLGIEERLELFVRVCDGVQHAHQNAVIHRDIKPSNILVTTVAGRPTPKIIDFGVAKALDGGPAPAGTLTQLGQIVGTPEYMSPEQAALDGRPADTRTDVYSLGVVLYELLVGERPFERDAGPGGSFVDLCRRVREEDPELPSARAARTTNHEPARKRGYVPKVLARRLRRDLDAIVIKALAKDPAGRYDSPSDLASDIEQFLQHRPISAHSPGLVDRLHKLFRRHRAATVAIASLSATLVGLAGVGTAQALRAHRASTRAEAEAKVTKQVRDFVLGVINPPFQWGTGEWPVDIRDTPSRESLLALIRQQFGDQPELESTFLLAAESHFRAYSAMEIENLIASRDRIASLHGPDSPEALDATVTLARAYTFTAGGAPRAESLLLDVLERQRRVGGSDRPGTWRATSLLGSVYKSQGQHEQAVPRLEAAIDGLERQMGADDRDLLSTKVLLSGSYLELRRYEETQALLVPAVDRIRKVFGERDFQTHVAFYNIGCALANSGNADGAFRYLQESIDRGWNYPFTIARDPLLLPLHGDPRFDALERAGRLNERTRWERWCFEAETRLREGRLADAERLLRDLIAAFERVDRSGAAGRAVIPRTILAKCLIRGGRFDDAEELLLQTLSAQRAHRIDDWVTLQLLAQCDIGRGKLESALARILAAAVIPNPVFQNVERYYLEAEAAAIRGQDDEALRILARASELGFDDVDQLEHDLAFGRLRARSEFAAIAKSARRRAL